MGDSRSIIALIAGFTLGGIAGGLSSSWVSSSAGSGDTDTFIMQRLHAIERELADNAMTVSDLDARLRAATRRSSTHEKGGNPLPSAPELAALMDKIEDLESSLQLLTIQRNSLPTEATRFDENLSRLASANSAEYKPSTAGEEIFQLDQGLPLNIDESSISDIAHDLGNGETLNDVSCKNSACKITLSKPQSRYSGQDDEQADLGDVLLFELSARHGLDNVEVHYGTDEQGDEVMYIHSPDLTRAD